MSDRIEPRHTAAKDYLRLALCSIAAGALLVGLGYWPTVKLASEAGAAAMLAGVGVSLVAALAGLAPPLLAERSDPRKRASGMFMGIVVRFAAVVLLTFGLVLSDLLPRTPLLLWIALSYLGLMLVDNVALVRLERRASDAQGVAKC